MEEWKDYLIRIVCAAVLTAIVTQLVPGKNMYAKFIRIICSVYLTLCAVAPLLQIRGVDIYDYIEEFDVSASAVVEEGTQIANEHRAAIIKERTETYILDKASSMGLSIDVEVMLSDSIPQLPYEVTLSGTAAPLHKKQLQDWIVCELGIEKEHQKWE